MRLARHMDARPGRRTQIRLRCSQPANSLGKLAIIRTSQWPGGSGNDGRGARMSRRPCKQGAWRMEEKKRPDGRNCRQRNDCLAGRRQAEGCCMGEAEWAMLEMHSLVGRTGIMRAIFMQRLGTVHRAYLSPGDRTSFPGSSQRMGNRWRKRRHQDSQAGDPGGKALLVSIESHTECVRLTGDEKSCNCQADSASDWRFFAAARKSYKASRLAGHDKVCISNIIADFAKRSIVTLAEPFRRNYPIQHSDRHGLCCAFCAEYAAPASNTRR